ncbi:MAG: hypothetical protein FWC13_12510 [Oscillospiraceae bacterium]|nr:hypothetical protein [Oscillospiraceae bacterium]
MKVNTNSNNINAQQLSNSAFPNRIGRNAAAQKLGVGTSDNLRLDDVQLTLSRRAQSMLTVVEGGVTAMLHRQEFEEFTHPDLIFSDEFSNEALSFLSSIQISLGFDQFSGWENLVANEETRAWLFENAEVAEMGNKLISGLGLNTHIDERNTGNAATIELANRYSEMRSSFEERYTGEELETMLSRLSDAFDLVVGHIANAEAETAYSRFGFQRFGVIKHNILVGQEDAPTLFNKGEIEVPEDGFQSLIENVVESIREATTHFARMTRDFVLENGAVTSESHIQLLNQFLQAAERPEGRLTFNNLEDTRTLIATHNRETNIFQKLQSSILGGNQNT